MPTRFVLDLFDTATTCLVETARFEVHEREVCSLLEIDIFPPHAAFDLDANDVDVLKEGFGLKIKTALSSTGVIRRADWHDDLPYQLHTDRELRLMLAGLKPLASFYDVEIPAEAFFDPYVASGRFLKREYTPLSGDKRLRRILYSLPIEEWRIDGFILLCQVADKVGWNEGFERMEGHLLGYEDWQCDAYFEARKKHRKEK